MVDDVAFLVTSSNSFPLPISIALDLSGLSLSQLELIQVPISEEQSDSNDAAISQLVTWGAGGKKQRGKRCKSWGPLAGLSSLGTSNSSFFPISLVSP